MSERTNPETGNNKATFASASFSASVLVVAAKTVTSNVFVNVSSPKVREAVIVTT